MNSLNSNPKNNMFYAAAQNLLNSHQNSYSMLRKNIQLPYGVNLRDKINTSNQNLSDRSLIQNNPRPKRLDIIMELKRYDKERSLSNLRNSSFDSIKSSHAYNIKGHFQQIHESQERIKEQDVQKNELKQYLLQQIEEKKRRQREQDELKRMEDQKAEEKWKRQLDEMKAKQKSIEDVNKSHQQQGTQTKPIPQNFYQLQKSNSPTHALPIQSLSSQENSNQLLQKLSNIQHDLMLMQTVKNVTNSDIMGIRETIKQQIKKQSQQQQQQKQQQQQQQQQGQGSHVGQLLYQKHPQVLERQLECETVFIPTDEQLQVELDLLSQTDLLEQQKQQEQQIRRESIHIQGKQRNQSNHTNQTQIIKQNHSYQQDPHQSRNQSFHSNIHRSNHHILNQQSQQISQLINHSRLTISQLSDLDKSISQDKKRQQSKSAKHRLSKEKEEKEKKLKLLQLKYPKIQHRTTMLMQIPTKNNEIQKNK